MAVTTGGEPEAHQIAPTGAVLAVDAGNTKTDVVVVGGDGRLLGSARGGGFQPPAVGIAVAVDALARTVSQALRLAGEPSVAQVTACLANADLPVEERELTAALTARGWGGRTRVANDTFALLRAGLPDDGAAHDGVAVVCGAGINCAGQRADGATHRFAALGALSGDWGGGGGLANAALWHAARAEDGRGADTELARALPRHFGLQTMRELIEAFHLGELTRSRRHELAPVLFAVATSGDRVAHDLVRRQAQEVVSLASVALERLGLLADSTPVILGGSVLTARHPQLHTDVLEGLEQRAPRARARVVTAPPVLGAGLLALDDAGAALRAHGALRARYARPNEAVREAV